MVKQIIITATGSDRPGIVSELSNIITSHGSNLEESRMSRMGSDFAIIMLISVPEDWEESLKLSLQSINDLAVSIKYTEEINKSEMMHYGINLCGADNEGIVKVLTKYLAEKSINIVELNTNISQAPVTGAPLFNLNSRVSLPDSLDIEEIKLELNQISSTLGVDIKFYQI